MQFETIYDSKTLKAVWNRGSDPTRPATGPAFVTFEGLGGLNKVRDRNEPFGALLAEKLGIDMIHIIPRAADWYHYDDMDACLEAVRPHVGADTLAYGSSMGAFAAAQFSDQLGIARAICFSPQYSIQPEIVPFEKRWRDYADRITFQHDDTIAPRQSKLWMFVDSEYWQELEHANLIAQSGPYEIIAVPHAGHPVGHALLEAGLLGKIIDLFLSKREEAVLLSRLMDITQENSVTVLMDKADKARGPAREALMRLAFALNTRNNMTRASLGVFLLRTGRTEEGHRILRPVFRPPVNPRFAKMYQRACEKSGIAPDLLDNPPARRSG